MFDLLQRLGCRFLTPAKAWTVVPEGTGLKMKAGKVFCSPDYDFYRKIWYANGTRQELWEDHNRFCRATRQLGIAPTSAGHNYATTIRMFEEEFTKHPEYFAMNQEGERPSFGEDGRQRYHNVVCASAPGLAELFLQSSIKQLEEMKKRNPKAFIVSMECKDGGGELPLRGLQSTGRQFRSDRVSG